MNILQALLVSEVCDGPGIYPVEIGASDVDLRKQYPTLQDAWEAKQDADEKYKLLLKLIRATNP